MNSESIVLEYIKGALEDHEDENAWLIKRLSQIGMSSEFQPDINGYTIITMIPPHLSGDETANNFVRLASNDFCFLALDFTPPEITVNQTQIGSGVGSVIPFASGLTKSGNVSVNYIETADLVIYRYHQYWTEYIDSVIMGDIKPGTIPNTGDSYLKPTEGGPVIDYLTSAFVTRYSPDLDTIVYLGKATGIHPMNLPGKEVIGVRSSNDLTMIPINYSCAYYTTATRDRDGNTDSSSSYIFDDFAKQIQEIT